MCAYAECVLDGMCVGAACKRCERTTYRIMKKDTDNLLFSYMYRYYIGDRVMVPLPDATIRPKIIMYLYSCKYMAQLNSYSFIGGVTF